VIDNTAKKTERAGPPTRTTRDTPPPALGGNKRAHAYEQLTPDEWLQEGSIRRD